MTLVMSFALSSGSVSATIGIRGSEAGCLPLRLGSRFFCRLPEPFRTDCGIELERRVLGGAGILAVLLVVAHEGNCHAVYRLPVVQVGFAQGWAALAERGISLFQDVTVLWIDKPTDRGVRGVHVDDAASMSPTFSVPPARKNISASFQWEAMKMGSRLIYASVSAFWEAGNSRVPWPGTAMKAASGVTTMFMLPFGVCISALASIPSTRLSESASGPAYHESNLWLLNFALCHRSRAYNRLTTLRLDVRID
jgi:hypothetical protein